MYSNTIGQSSIQHTTLNQLNITKQIFLIHTHEKIKQCLTNINQYLTDLFKI